MKYCDCVIDNKSRATDSMFTYICREDDISPGQKVYVPFGRSKNLREAYVMDVRDSCEGTYELKEIDHRDGDICLSAEIVETVKWMRRRYLIKYIDGLRCFVPPGHAPKRVAEAAGHTGTPEAAKKLTEEQQRAYDEISASIDGGRSDIFLMNGVTSSGKTEVYMQVIAGVVARGRKAVMMVPEVALTEEMMARFEKRFGADNVAILHYKLTRAQRYIQWKRIREGRVKIVVGARSAVFAPFEDIGVFIMDEEHDPSYKSDMTPKYDTLDVAVKRGRAWNAPVILGSATPSLVSVYRARQGIYREVRLTRRYNDNPLPEIRVTDMNEELRNGNTGIISSALYDIMKEDLKAKRQVILFLNRRGFSTCVRCLECGEILRCPDCGISLTYHKDSNALRCHYCGRSFRDISRCPRCGGRLVRKGTGTEKAVEDIEKLFDGYRVDRLDLDTAAKKGGAAAILNRFRRRETDILIGTQMVTKGLDFDNVGSVGILMADSELAIPDFRSPERTFQLITQVAGRAGRGDFRGKVVIQTHVPDNYVIRYAAAGDSRGFYEEETELRRLMDYPPFSDLIKLLVTGRDEDKVRSASIRIYEHMMGELGRIKMFYPAPAPMNRIKDIYRYQILIKCPPGERYRYLRAVDSFKTDRDTGVGVDINPYSFT